MSYTEAIVLAVLQGLTEFLPVSSSGHLVLAQQLFGDVGEADLLYDVLLHVATTLAVLAYFRRDLLALARGWFRPGSGSDGFFHGQERRLVGWVLLASVPTGVLGLGVKRWLLAYVTRADAVGAMLLLTAALLWFGRSPGRAAGRATMGAADAVAIGVMQGFAVLPGISRSGATITTGLVRGLSPELAARFSLLVSLPAIAAAAVLELSEALRATPPPPGPVLAGMAIATVVGYLSIGAILWALRRRRFHWFAAYLAPLGTAAILWYHLG